MQNHLSMQIQPYPLKRLFFHRTVKTTEKKLRNDNYNFFFLSFPDSKEKSFDLFMFVLKPKKNRTNKQPKWLARRFENVNHCRRPHCTTMTSYSNKKYINRLPIFIGCITITIAFFFRIKFVNFIH